VSAEREQFVSCTEREQFVSCTEREQFVSCTGREQFVSCTGREQFASCTEPLLGSGERVVQGYSELRIVQVWVAQTEGLLEHRTWQQVEHRIIEGSSAPRIVQQVLG